MPALLLILAFFFGILGHREWMKFRERSCDACRIDAMNDGAWTWTPHTCSKSRGFYRDKSGEVLQFGRKKGEQVR